MEPENLEKLMGKKKERTFHNNIKIWLLKAMPNQAIGSQTDKWLSLANKRK